MKYLALIPATFFLMSSGCADTKGDNDEQAALDSTASGLKYTIYTQSEGAKPNKKDYVFVSYAGYLLDSNGNDGKKFDASYDRNQPIGFQYGTGAVIPGWDEGIGLLGTGDSALFVIPPKLGYGDKALDVIPANSTLRFRVKLESIEGPELGMPFSIGAEDTITDPSGIKYAFIKKSNWASAKPGNTVLMHYRGYLLNGTVFDQSVTKGRPFNFQLGSGGVIQGWDIMAAKMNVGDKVRVIIPANLAYGENGSGPIPGGSTLVFDIVMMGAF